MRLVVLLAILFSLQSAARVTSVNSLPDGVEYEADGVKTRLRVVTPEIIRVTSTVGEFAPDSSLIVLPCESQGKYTSEITQYHIILFTPKIFALVNMDDGAVKFYDIQGKLLLKESTGGKSFTPVTV